jgi:hypothetical protein
VTDLDTFRRALKGQDAAGHPSPERDAPAARALDAGQIMARGRRLRWRRRLVAGAGSLCLAAAAAGVVTGLSHLTRPPADLDLHPATSGRSTPVPGDTGGPAPSPEPTSVREGQVIATGIQAGDEELVFYAVRIHNSQLPRIRFGIMAGLRSRAGTLTPAVETNETTGAGTAPGFHAIEAPMNVGSPEVAVPEFGYYAGPAAAITAQQGGRTVAAQLARWSADSSIVIFWFPATIQTGAPVASLAAYSSSGHLLPAGHTAPGHG